MASINNIVNKVQTGSTKIPETNMEGVGDQILSNVESLNQTAQSIKNSATQASNAAVSAAKNGVEKVSSSVKGMIPGQANAYVARTAQEKQKSYDADTNLYSNIDLNELVLPYENPLLAFHNYTWNFSLYTMSPAEYELFLDNDTADVNKYVVAQSAVTGRYSIESVKITQAGPATPGITSNYSMNTAIMEIKENGGQHLFDDLVVLSNTLGYKKFMDVPFVMELNFIGFDEDSGAPTTIKSLNRKWGVRLNTIQGSASQSGGAITYTLSLSSTRGGMMENKDWTLKEPYTCTTGTFGEFIQQLQDHMNKVATDQYGYLRYRYDAFSNDEYFKMILPTELANMTINYDSKQSPEVNQTKSGASGAKDFTWGADVPVSRVIDDVLDCCMPLHESTDKRRNFVNIIPVSRYVGYDPIRDTSAYKNFFYILKYKIGDVTSKDDLLPESFNLQYFYDNADKISDETDPNKKPKINGKRYDYQFSGLNTEILNLDIKYDQGFNIAVTRNPQSQIDKQNSTGTHVAETLELAGQEYSTADTAQLWAKSQELVNKQKAGQELTDEERQFIRDAQGASASRVMPTEGETDQSNLNLSMAPALPSYIEDFRNTIDIGVEGTNGIGTPRVDSVPTEPTNIGKTNSGAKGDNSSDDELQRRLIRDNYYNRSFLGKLDIKVVGDPFWLGWGDYSYIRYLERAARGEDLNPSPEDRHFANYMTSETYLLLNLKPIVAISDDTGILEVNQKSVFNQNFYRVNKVVSEFSSNGSFTQQLTAGLVIRSLRNKDQQSTGTQSAESVKKDGKQ
ncbi:hypothetical protein XbC2_238 [Xanthomonas phage XbC2]|nr:hypothetical protein XbC2_238 [Xanthomonas phage XbC2]